MGVSLSDILQPLRGKAKNNVDVYGFDVETEHIRKDFLRKNGKSVKCWRQDFVMGSIVGKDYNKVFWEREKMGEHMLSRKFRGSMMYATNLEFDFNILYHDCLKDFNMIYRHGLLAATHRETTGDDDKKRRRLWTFVESGNIMKSSVEKMGKIVGEEKLPKPAVMGQNPEGIGIIARRPKNKEEEDELVKYNLQDSRITYLFAEHFRDFCTRHNMKMKLTIGSTGMDYWRRNWQNCGMIREPTQLLVKHFQGAFRGGMTQVFRRGYYQGKIFCYDFKSSYPGVMLKGVDGKGGYPHPSCYVHVDKANTELIEEYEGICYAKVKAPYSNIPKLGIKHNGKLMFCYGTFEGWFTNYELRQCMKEGYEVTPGEMTYYHTLFVPFKGAVKELYRIRQEYKHWKKNPDGTWERHPYEEMVKVLMNGGLFGKWGTNFLEMEEVKSAEGLVFDNKGRAWLDGEVLENFSISNEALEHGLVCLKKKSCPPMRYSFPILSTYTTMLGRMKLINALTPYYKYLAYGDTDSGYMTKRVFEEGEELGDWEMQLECDGALFIRNKLYKLDINDQPSVCKSKGVGKFMKKGDDFMRAISTGRILMERFTKMKESSRIGIMSGSVMQLTKDFNLEDDKRDWKGKKFSVSDWQDSEPLMMKDGMLPVEFEKAQRKALEQYKKDRAADDEAYLNSDLFDLKSVGTDIPAQEFLKNERAWGRRGEEH